MTLKKAKKSAHRITPNYTKQHRFLRFLFCERATVGAEVGNLGKRCTTLLAHIGLLPCVYVRARPAAEANATAVTARMLVKLYMSPAYGAIP